MVPKEGSRDTCRKLVFQKCSKFMTLQYSVLTLYVLLINCESHAGCWQVFILLISLNRNYESHAGYWQVFILIL